MDELERYQGKLLTEQMNIWVPRELYDRFKRLRQERKVKTAIYIRRKLEELAAELEAKAS